MKRMISLFLLVTMILSLIIPTQASAQEMGTITIPDIKETAGTIVNVDVKIKNNPGILGATLTIRYDERLQLLEAQNGSAFQKLTMTRPGAFTSPCNFVWDGQELANSDILDGVILTLKFKIPDDAVPSTKYSIQASYEDGAIVNNYLNPVNITINNGGIEVLNVIYGDVNSDRKINASDIILLRRHIAGGYSQTIEKEAADVNIDGKINATDTILTRRYIAGGYNISLPYIPSECNHVMEAFPAKAATEHENGNIAYWHCKICNKYFKDERGTVETTLEETIIPKLTADVYSIQYVCDMVPIGPDHRPITYSPDTYTSSQVKILPQPKMDTYQFLGWTDKKGNLYHTEIPKGTTGDLVLYANWASNRNLAVPVEKLENPLICEDSDHGQIYFVYELGKIINIPIFETQDLLVVDGLVTSTGVVKQTSIAKNNAENVGKAIAKTTTNSATWTLSEEWNKNTTISNEWSNQQGMSSTEAESFCKGENNTYNLVNSSEDTSGLVKSNDSTFKRSENKAHADSVYSDTEKYAGYEVNGKLSNTTELSASINAGITVPLIDKAQADLEAGVEGKNTTAWEIGGNYENNVYTQDVKTSTSNWNQNDEASSSSSNISSDTKKWNTAEGFTSSQSIDISQSVSKEISELVSEKHAQDTTYTTGGANGESKEYATTNAENDLYSSSVTFSSAQIAINDRKFESLGRTYGAYRLVQTGMARVFGIVGYDIKNKTYYTHTYSVLDDDVYKEYLDYSYDRSFNDYETSVLPFEIPAFVNDYVNSRIASSKLEIGDNGIVTKYLGSADEKIAVIPSYYTRINHTTGESEVIKIKGIAPGLFKDNTNIVRVTLGTFINEIPDSAFEGCTSLKEIYCPNVVRFGDYAFRGCSALSEFLLPDEIETIGRSAFDGTTALKCSPLSKEAAVKISKSQAKNITLDISKINAADYSDMVLEVGSIDTFKLLGRYKNYNGLAIKSDAQSTVISGITTSNSDKIPIEVSSPNLTLERVNVNSQGFSLVMKAPETVVSLEGVSSMQSQGENSIMAKNITFLQSNPQTHSELNTNAWALICGNITNNNNYLDVNRIRTISEGEFNSYLTSRTVYFDANGGTASLTSMEVPYNSRYGTLPTAIRDYYQFAGWYTAFDGGSRVTSETVMNSMVDVTLYAHWIPNDVSSWVLKSEMPENAQVVDTKYTYDHTSYTTSSDSNLSGWTLYDTRSNWSDYGGWSGWQTEYVGGSDSREVQTQSVQNGYNQKTQWRYTRYRSGGQGHYAYGYKSGDCVIYDTTGWLDSPLPKQADHSCGPAYGKGYKNESGKVYPYIYWYNEVTREVDDRQSPIYVTQYRYRDRHLIYTYYYSKVEKKESSSYPSGSNISNVNEWVRYRAK